MNSRLPKMLNCAHEKIPGRCISGAKLPEDAMALSLMGRGGVILGAMATKTRTPNFPAVSAQFWLGVKHFFNETVNHWRPCQPCEGY